MNRFEKELFTLAISTIQNVPIPPYVSWALVLLHDIQLLAFAFHPSFFQRDPPTWLSQVVAIVRLNESDDLFLISLVIAFLVIVCALVCPPTVRFLLSRHIKVPIYIQQASRLLVTSLLMCLSIPVLRLIVGSLKCMDNALGAPHSGCSRPSSTMYILFGMIAACLFIPFSLIGNLVFYGPQPRPHDPLAKVHGELDARVFQFLALLVVLDVAHPAMGVLGQPLFALSGVVNLGYLSFCFVEHQVYYNPRVSASRAGLMAASSVAMLTSSILHASAVRADESAWATLAVAGLGFAVVTAFSLLRGKRHLNRIARFWHRVKHHELQLQMEQRNRELALSNTNLVGSRRNLAAGSHSRLGPPAPQVVQPSMVLGSRIPKDKTQVDNIQSLLKETSADILNIARERAPRGRLRVFSDPFQVELCCRSIKASPTPTRIALGMQLLERGLVEFKDHPLISLQLLSYLSTFFRNESAITVAKISFKLRHTLIHDQNISLGIKYRLFLWVQDQQRQQDKEEAEALKTRAQQNHAAAHRTLLKLWEAIHDGTPRPQLSRLLSVLGNLQAAAKTSYMELLARNPRDLAVLKSYGEYLQTVEADLEKSEQVLEFAEDVLTQEIKRNKAESSSSARAQSTEGDKRTQSVSQSGLLFNIPEDAGSLSSDQNGSGSNGFGSNNSFSSGGSIGSLGTNRSDEAGFPRVRGIAAGYASSQASGATAAQRQQQQLRRALADRIMAPLRPKWPLLLSLGLFAVSYFVGFWFCNTFFTRTLAVLERFTIGRNGRGAVLEVIEDLRSIALTRDPLEYMEQMNQLRTNSLPRAVALLPLLADDETQLSAALRSEMLVRVFTPVFTQQSTDFIADDVSPVDLVTKIVNAANLVVSAYAAPTSLSTQVFNSTLEFRFMAENFAAIVFGIMQLGLSSVREYNALVRTNMAIVSSCAVVALCAVFTTALVMYKKMLKRFLNYEDRILALLQHMPEGIAASVKSQLEERIKFVSEAESPMTGASTATSSKWKSIVGGDADEYDVVTGTEADPNDLESEGQAGLSGRKARYRTGLLAASVLLVAVVFGTFGTTLTSESVQKDVQRYMYSGNRRFSSITWRVFSQEHFLSDGTFPITDIVKNSRIALRNLQHYHDLLTNDANGPSAMFPNHTIFPRDCTHKLACPGAPEMDDVGMGWTRAIASQPLNAEIDRLIQIGHQVAESMVDDMLNESTALSRATAHAQWRLSLALSRDIVLRSTELNELMRSRMRAQLAHASIVCNVMLVVTVMVLVACALAYQAACAGPLLSEARTVVTLLYMIPPNLLKEAKDVARFCETAGVELEIKSGK